MASQSYYHPMNFPAEKEREREEEEEEEEE
jgi:hypothetical protein